MNYFLVYERQVDKILMNIITFQIKTVRKNVFMVISSKFGRIIWSRSAGSFGFKCWYKKSNEALSLMLASALSKLVEVVNDAQLFIRVCGLNKRLLEIFYKEFIIKLKTLNITFLGCKFVVKVAFNGCRKKSVA